MHSRFGSDISGVAAVNGLLAGTVFAVLLLLAFLFLRRLVRARYLQQRDECAMWVRANWNEIVGGAIPASEWKRRVLTRRVVEEIALDRKQVAGPDESIALDRFFRESGLLEFRKHLARRGRGWERQEAVQALGRMGAVEAAGAIADALDECDADLVLEAVRALAKVGTSQAGASLVARLRESLNCPAPVLESALLTCYRNAPEDLLRETLDAPEQVRPLLSRALAGIAHRGMPGEVVVLAADPSPDVRASAARILGIVAGAGAAGALCQLIEDSVWFVRLRAAIALGALADPYTIPSILRALCDENRLVRLRAACSLAAFDGHERRILDMAHSTGDRYALQAFVGELDRAGKLEGLIAQVAPAGAGALAPVIEGGAIHRIEEIAATHPDAVVRQQAARALAEGLARDVLPGLESIACAMDAAGS